MPERFTWRREGYDDADAADDRLLAAHTNGDISRGGSGPGGAIHPTSPAPTAPPQPLGELLPALRNQAIQSQQVADGQRRRAARAEARLAQLRGDLAWIVVAVAIGAFGCGFIVAWAIVRRGGGL